jgi:hypothetical protein
MGLARFEAVEDRLPRSRVEKQQDGGHLPVLEPEMLRCALDTNWRGGLHVVQQRCFFPPVELADHRYAPDQLLESAMAFEISGPVGESHHRTFKRERFVHEIESTSVRVLTCGEKARHDRASIGRGGQSTLQGSLYPPAFKAQVDGLLDNRMRQQTLAGEPLYSAAAGDEHEISYIGLVSWK